MVLCILSTMSVRVSCLWMDLTMLPIILLGLILGAEALSVEEMLEFGGKRFQELKQSMSNIELIT